MNDWYSVAAAAVKTKTREFGEQHWQIPQQRPAGEIKTTAGG